MRAPVSGIGLGSGHLGLDLVREADRRSRNAMLDTMFSVATVVFFAASLLYVRFCDGLR